MEFVLIYVNMIQMSHVYKTYKTHTSEISALCDINLEISGREFVFIAGPNGSGKTTLLRILFGAERPSSGEVIVNGINITEKGFNQVYSLRRTAGIVFQDFRLLGDRTVGENIIFALEVTGHSRNEAKNRVSEILNWVGLQERGKDLVFELSAGEQQRVAIARALINDPPLLLADEPMGNLDPQMTIDVMGMFTSLHLKGTTVVFATHDIDLVQRYPYRTICLSGGKRVDPHRDEETGTGE
jgi:cell division transport system ATP-binding protein